MTGKAHLKHNAPSAKVVPRPSAPTVPPPKGSALGAVHSAPHNLASLALIRPADLAKVECLCGHTELLTARMLTTASVKPHQLILDLKWRLRCRRCKQWGRTLVSIRWQNGLKAHLMPLTDEPD